LLKICKLFFCSLQKIAHKQFWKLLGKFTKKEYNLNKKQKKRKFFRFLMDV